MSPEKLFFGKHPVFKTIQEQKSIAMHKCPFAPELHLFALLSPLDRPHIRTMETDDPLRNATNLPALHLQLLRIGLLRRL